MRRAQALSRLVLRVLAVWAATATPVAPDASIVWFYRDATAAASAVPVQTGRSRSQSHAGRPESDRNAPA